MENMKNVFREEIESLREKGHKFLNGELNVMQFKHASGGMGVYAHKGGKEFMVRLRISSGVTNLEEMNKIYNLVKKYGVNGVHFTTRQAIQIHGLSIDEICDLMLEALDLDIFTRGAGGNFPRNVALSPLAGVNRNEAFDATPYALSANKYFMERITTYKLPRKLKVSFSGSNCDGAHVTVQDLGFLAVKDENGENKFKVYLGGGLGQNPRLAVSLEEIIEPSKVLYYIEGMVSMFMAEGDYENRNKARVRYILERMGEEAFLNCYREHVKKAIEKGGLDLNITEKKVEKEGKKASFESSRVYEQKQEGLYAVYVHPTGGQLKLSDLKNILDLLKDSKEVDIRLCMTEGAYFRNLNGDEAKKLLDLTDDFSGKTKFEQSVACIGAPTCQIGMCNSQQNLRNILAYFKEKNFSKDVLPRVYISGCPNSCGVHEIGEIGFTGKKQRVDGEVKECFELHIGGSFRIGKAKLGKIYGVIETTKIPEFLYELALSVEKYDKPFGIYIEENRIEMESIIDKYIVK